MARRHARAATPRRPSRRSQRAPAARARRAARSATSAPPRRSARCRARAARGRRRALSRRGGKPRRRRGPRRERAAPAARHRHAAGGAGRRPGSSGCAPRGIDAEALPLIEIAPLADAAPCTPPGPDWPQRRLVVFVSANAVRAFLRRAAGRCGLAGRRRSPRAPGPGTADALRDAGVAEAAIVAPAGDAAQFDSEVALGAPARARLARRARADRARRRRPRLAGRAPARRRRARSSRCRAYRREAPRLRRREGASALDAGARRRRRRSGSSAAPRRSPTSSAPPARSRFGHARALATHPRIAERARGAGFGRRRRGRRRASTRWSPAYNRSDRERRFLACLRASRIAVPRLLPSRRSTAVDAVAVAGGIPAAPGAAADWCSRSCCSRCWRSSPCLRLARRPARSQQRARAGPAPAGQRAAGHRGDAAGAPGAGRRARGRGQGRAARGAPRTRSRCSAASSRS